MTKCFSITIVVCFLAPLFCSAQKVSEQSIKMGNNQLNGYAAVSNHGKAEMKAAMEEKLTEAGIKKDSKKKGFYVYKGVSWPAISPNKVDVYYKVKGNGRKSTVYFVSSKGYDNYITSASDAQGASNITAFLQTLDAQIELDKQIKEKEAQLKKLNDEAKKKEEKAKDAQQAEDKKAQELQELKRK